VSDTTERPERTPSGPALPEKRVSLPSADERPKIRSRARERYRSTRAHAEARWHEVEESRSRFTPVDVAFRAYERDRLASGPIVAGALSYRLFLWLIPYTLVLVVTIGFFADLANSQPEKVAKDAGLPAYLAATVAESTAQSQTARWLLLLAGLWTLLLATRSVAKTLRSGFAMAWRVPIPRNGTTRVTGTVGVTLIALTLAGMLAAGLRARTSGPALLIMALMILAYVVAWVWISIQLPHPVVPWRVHIPGALLMAVGAQALYLISVLWYMPHAERASSAYGALEIAILLLGWLFIISRLAVVSPVLNAVLWERRHPMQALALDDGPAPG
jgi:uncharacterized BrkB/YihY/UPF0761 family membrane protein